MAAPVSSNEFVRRLLARDPSLFPGDPEKVAGRLGWVEAFRIDPTPILRMADEARADGLQWVVVLGMGGSSLAPEVSARWYDFESVSILDTSNPVEVGEELARVGDDTLYLISSKSGTTVETASLAAAFQAKAARNRIGVVCDPGTPMEDWARRNAGGFLLAPPDVGGRFSAHTPFHLLPLALAGGDVARFLASAELALEGPSIRTAVDLGDRMAEAVRAGRNKMVVETGSDTAAIFPWIQQLVAESTGKEGTGLLPIRAQGQGDGPDRFPVAVRCAKEDLGGEFLRWMVATARAGALLGVNPFDEPDVTVAKEMSRRALEEGEPSGASVASAEAVAQALSDSIRGLEPPGYLDLLAFLPRVPTVERAIEGIRTALARRTRAVVTSEIGPRYLHSTGQFHKGGPNQGRFVVFSHRFSGAGGDGVPIPGTPHTFSRLCRAQARGDAAALAARGRTSVHLDLGEDPAGVLTAAAGMLG